MSATTAPAVMFSLAATAPGPPKISNLSQRQEQQGAEFPDLLAQWTTEEELALLKAIVSYKPAGMHKHFRIIAIRESMLRAGVIHENHHTTNRPSSSMSISLPPVSDQHQRHLSIPGIWQKLESLYDLKTLDEREDEHGLLMLEDDDSEQEGNNDVETQGAEDHNKIGQRSNRRQDGHNSNGQKKNLAENDGNEAIDQAADSARAARSEDKFFRDFRLPSRDFEGLMWTRRLNPEGTKSPDPSNLNTTIIGEICESIEGGSTISTTATSATRKRGRSSRRDGDSEDLRSSPLTVSTPNPPGEKKSGVGIGTGRSGSKGSARANTSLGGGNNVNNSATRSSRRVAAAASMAETPTNNRVNELKDQSRTGSRGRRAGSGREGGRESMPGSASESRKSGRKSKRGGRRSPTTEDEVEDEDGDVEMRNTRRSRSLRSSATDSSMGSDDDSAEYSGEGEEDEGDAAEEDEEEKGEDGSDEDRDEEETEDNEGEGEKKKKTTVRSTPSRPSGRGGRGGEKGGVRRRPPASSSTSTPASVSSTTAPRRGRRRG